MIKFRFEGKKVKHNLVEIIADTKLLNSEVVALTMYHLKLLRWWEFYYNSNQPTEVFRVCFPESEEK
jgi:hypothetical protein